MKLFSRRTPADSVLPPEIQAYAVAEQRERRGMAWIVGILSLLTTLLILAVLFVGGRWVYRKISQQDDRPINVSQGSESKPKETPAKPSAGTTDTADSGASSTNQPVQAPAATQPATGDNGAETLVRTGPDIDL